MSYQKLIIVGYLGNEPEMRYTPDGTPVTNFNVATSYRWTNRDGSKGEETVWFRVTVWRKQAEIAQQYLQKGRQVMVEGRMTPDKTTGKPRVYQKSDGSYGASYEVTAERIIFLGTKGGDAAASGGSSASGDNFDAGFDPSESDIPF